MSAAARTEYWSVVLRNLAVIRAAADRYAKRGVIEAEDLESIARLDVAINYKTGVHASEREAVKRMASRACARARVAADHMAEVEHAE
jgi:hypothetical protein